MITFGITSFNIFKFILSKIVIFLLFYTIILFKTKSLSSLLDIVKSYKKFS